MKAWWLMWLVAVPAWSYAQDTYSVSGSVYSTEDKEPIVGATAVLYSLKDSTQRYFATSDIDGNFVVNDVPGSFYRLEVRSVGFGAFDKIIRVSSDLELGRIGLSYDTMQLNAVEVKGQTIGVIISGDTTQYLANAYKTNPDASAEDLIRKMPGVIVDENGVQAQGESVQKVLVDGKEFFGNDPSIALKTIPAEVIDKIEIFDQLSEQSQFTGFDDGNRTKTVNIVTKSEMKNGRFGRGYSGLGTDGKYNAGGNLNLFNDDQRITLLGMANNVNIQNFSSEDLLGVSPRGNITRIGGMGMRIGGGPGGGGGGRRGMLFTSGSNPNDFLTGQQDGISEIRSFGGNYTDDIGEKLKVTASYFYNGSDNTQAQSVRQEYFLDDSENQVYDETSVAESKNDNHRVNLRLNYRIDDRSSILFTPRFSVQQNNLVSGVTGVFQSAGGVPLSTTDNHTLSAGTGYHFSNDLLIRHRFNTPGRTISLGVRTSINKTEKENILDALTTYSGDQVKNDTTNQLATHDVTAQTWAAHLRYTERLGESLMLQLGYHAGITANDADRETFRLSGEADYSELDTALSNLYESQYLTHNFNTGLMLRKSALMARAGLAYEFAALEGDNIFPVADRMHRIFRNVLPNLMLMYELSRERNLRLFYRAGTREPSVTQLQDVVDNSNPVSVTSGNPNLRQSYTHTLMSRYSSTNVKKGTSFFALLSFDKTDHYISNSTLIAQEDTVIQNGVVLQRGSQLTMPVNMDGYLSSRAFVTYGLPISLLASNLNFNTTIVYTNTPGLVNGQENESHSTSLGQGIVLASNISENVDFTLSYDGSYNLVQNSLQPELNENYYYQVARARLNLIFPKDFVLRTEYSHQQYSGLSESYNEGYSLWNVSVGKKLFPDKRGEINVSVFDLLGENTSISRTVTETYVEDAQSEVLSTYFMVNFIYNFRNYN